MSPKIRLLLVDDHAMFRDGLAHALGKENDILVVGQCSSSHEALALLPTRPNLVLLDVDLGAERGLGFIRELRGASFEGRFLIVTAGISGLEAIQLVEAGVSGIIHKQHPTEALLEAIRTVCQGERYLEPCYISVLMRSTDRTRVQGQPRLTDRDRSALRYVLQGLTNREIGANLGISEGAVKASLHQLFEKLGARTRAQLVKIALEQFREQI